MACLFQAFKLSWFCAAAASTPAAMCRRERGVPLASLHECTPALSPIGSPSTSCLHGKTPGTPMSSRPLQLSRTRRRCLVLRLAEERLLGSVGYLATSNAAFDVTMDYIRDRKAFGRTIADFQNTRFRMADMRMEIDIAQTFIDQFVLEHNDGGRHGSDSALSAG